METTCHRAVKDRAALSDCGGGPRPSQAGSSESAREERERRLAAHTERIRSDRRWRGGDDAAARRSLTAESAREIRLLYGPRYAHAAKGQKTRMLRDLSRRYGVSRETLKRVFGGSRRRIQ